ncbi:AsnC family transcriptional regulator [Streptomyces sp. H39-S7]|uniref:AsnC family transcriptional regulator n=1 Tax=Streptomyces sp. H39-S7 TaxID=3004357 RepID=UPI0022B013B1|nr:AsnC family transcriptional regulator [Streptomyces sp. H39-S7]MCZ4119864.1 AsnC family transcriptional regulator [Streptomyces sp. H39-S7]
MESLDEIDRAILGLLQTDGRLTGAEVGRRVGLSQPAAGARIQRLEKSGSSPAIALSSHRLPSG